jgi:hypothetical protein
MSQNWPESAISPSLALYRSTTTNATASPASRGRAHSAGCNPQRLESACRAENPTSARDPIRTSRGARKLNDAASAGAVGTDSHGRMDLRNQLLFAKG